MQILVEKETPLIDVLITLSPTSSKTTLRSWIKEGRVFIDGKIAKQSNDVVGKGQQVSIGSKTKFATYGIPLIYEDQHLIAVDKPEGLLSVATAFEKGETVHALLKKKYHPRQVYVVHRLDQDTSGVMLYALSREGYQGLKLLFEKHTIERSYCGIVEGKLIPPEGSWKSYLYEDNNYVVHSTPNEELGRLSITHYKVLNSSDRYSLVNFTLETGRKNQIRVHCGDSGHPIVGDKKYGATSDPIKRLCLHAQSISFVHPVTQKQLSFVSPIPKAFDRLVHRKS